MSTPAPIIIGGCGRSGTTLLRMMLDAHPAITCGPELKAIPIIAQQHAEFVRLLGPLFRTEFGLGEQAALRSSGARLLALLEEVRARSGKPRVAEKTPQNIHHFSLLSKMLPEARLIHLIRDGRDVVVSLLEQNWVDLATGQPVAYTNNARAAAKFWAQAVAAGRAVKPDFDGYLEVRYEDLARHPETTLRTILEHVGESWDPAMLSFHETVEDKMAAGERPSHADKLTQPVHARSIGRFVDRLSDVQKEAFKEEAGDLLIELGYATDDRW